jgi:predicted transposase/invertase (TIGR01784 family)
MTEKEVQGRYMDLKTDFAFKLVFVNEEDKSAVISLLNEILKGRCTVADVEYLLPEQLGNTEKERKAFFDLYCRNERGERFVIEMQVARHKNFIDRCLFYMTFPIQNQAVKGEEWDYHLEPIFFIAIMDFTLWTEHRNYISYHSLMNEETREIVSDKIQLVTIELDKFLKTEDELETYLDYWLYCFKHAPELESQPKKIQGKIFNKLFYIIDTGNLTHKDMEAYNKSVTEYADVRFVMASNREEGMEIGYKKGIEEGTVRGIERGIKKGMVRGMERGVKKVALNLLDLSIPINDISKATGLTPEQIRQIKK